MLRFNSTKYVLICMIGTLLLTGISSSYAKEVKIPITTSSEKALKYFQQGQDMLERLRHQEARQYLEKAIAEDSNFAKAYLDLSYIQPTTNKFFEMLNKALALADKVSKAERLMILAAQAGSNGDPMTQREYYKQLVRAYPKDERARNLLGSNYFELQDYSAAIQQYEKSIKIDPEYSPPYNMLGYSYRYLGNYVESEKAFKKYIELIPDDSNPYDSYGELLMKMGKFHKSIELYQKALEIDSFFYPSRIGIATNLNLLGQHQQARKQLKRMYDLALHVAQQREAVYATAVSYADEGNLEQALEEMKKTYALAENEKDIHMMAYDLINQAAILIEMGKFDEALSSCKKSLDYVEKSELPDEIKEYSRRGYLRHVARIALEKKDFATAKVKAEEFRQQVEVTKNPLQIRLAYQIAGIISLAEKNFDQAILDLQYSNLQSPYNVYRLGLAYQGKGDTEKAKELIQKAAYFNALNNLSYAFIRSKAQKMLEEM